MSRRPSTRTLLTLRRGMKILAYVELNDGKPPAVKVAAGGYEVSADGREIKIKIQSIKSNV